VLIVMSTVPAASDGEVTVQLVVVQETLVAAEEPKLAVVKLVPDTKPVPVIVTTAPPASGPALGAMPVIVGTGS